MPTWIAKAAAQRAISILPKSQFWNYLLQKHVTGSLDLDAVWFPRKLRECRWHLENFFNTSAHSGACVLELGTGWYPIIPLSFWLCGVSKIFTFDIQPVLRPEAIRNAFKCFIDSDNRGELAMVFPWLKKDRIGALKTMPDTKTQPTEILGDLGIETRVQDVRNSGLESGSIDFIFSNGVLHEIPERILIGIFGEFKRVASPHAAMSHYVILQDVYSNFDHSITPFNFLKYPDWAWSLINNPLQYHNRLRVSDYRRIHQCNGFSVLYEHDEQGSPADLERVRVASKFRSYSSDELLLTRSWMVSSRKPERFTTSRFSPGWVVMPVVYAWDRK